MAQHELVIKSDRDCDSNVDFIIEVKKRLDFIESLLGIEVKKEKIQSTVKV